METKFLTVDFTDPGSLPSYFPRGLTKIMAQTDTVFFHSLPSPFPIKSIEPMLLGS